MEVPYQHAPDLVLYALHSKGVGVPALLRVVRTAGASYIGELTCGETVTPNIRGFTHTVVVSTAVAIAMKHYGVPYMTVQAPDETGLWALQDCARKALDAVDESRENPDVEALARALGGTEVALAPGQSLTMPSGGQPDANEGLRAAQAIESLGNSQALARLVQRMWESSQAFHRTLINTLDAEDAKRHLGPWTTARTLAERILAGPKVDRGNAVAKRKVAARAAEPAAE